MRRVALLTAMTVAALVAALAAVSVAVASPTPGAVATVNGDGTVTIVMTQEGYGPYGIGGWSCSAGDYPGLQRFPNYTVASFTVVAANGPGSFTASTFVPGDPSPFGGFRPAGEYGVDITNGADSNAWITLTLTCQPPPLSADLSVTKADSPDPGHVGQKLTYTIPVTNNGPDSATAVTLTDTLPKTTGFGTVSTTQGTCTRTKTGVTCNLGNLASGATATVTIVVKPTQKGTITNTVTVTDTSPSDPNTANNTATQSTTVKP
jgi:uncharacterized repeat protein (TIGR01451 family)